MKKKIFIQILLIILILIIFFGVYQRYFKKIVDLNDPVLEQDSSKQDNNLINITYESVDNTGRKYIISAESGLINEKEPDLIFMTNVSAEIFLLDKSTIYIESQKAEYNSLNYDTKFQDNIKLEFKEHNVFCDNLNIFFKDNLLEAYNNLTYKNLNIIMTADKIELDLLTKNSKIFNYNENKVKIEKKN